MNDTTVMAHIYDLHLEEIKILQKRITLLESENILLKQQTGALPF